MIVVTAARTEQELSQAASLVSVLDATDLESTPAFTLDDHLRRLPGFSLFRRSSSLVAHPTTQGVSLRGIGPSGAGRSLVLLDGVPLNDPFGGWIYWNRVPPATLETVEVVRGATSQLYGSSAMGGTIQLLARPSQPAFELEGQIGDHKTFDGAALVAGRQGDWNYLLSGRAFTTDGFYLLRRRDRGAVDARANSEFQSFYGRAGYRDFRATLNVFHEDRGNGTRLQTNDSHMELLDLGVTKPDWKWNFYAQPGLFESVFTSISANRATETVTERQRVPTAALGSSASRLLARKLLVGADWRYARALSRGQNLAGVFAQDTFTVARRVDLLLGGRVDSWQNRGTHGGFNPRAGLVIRAAESITLRASGYRGFRAPTLNELYRPFRVGNIFTQANSDLRIETLWGGEAGADFHPTGSLLVRVNGFWNSLDNPVGNITLSSSGGQILRQRRNIGGVVIRGLETETTLRHGDHWRFRAAYLYSSTRVESTGLRLPQTPRHMGSLGVTYLGPFTATVEGRALSFQFDDDLNRLRLGGYPLVDLMLRRAVSPRVDLFLAVENLLGRGYAVQRTPIEQVGTPRLVHGGVRFRVGR